MGPAQDQFEREADDAADRVMRSPVIALLPGRDFSHVRVHTDVHAAESARVVNARAYTVGAHVVFGDGQFAPQTTAGRQLLAHELAHVAQQGSSGARVQRWNIIDEIGGLFAGEDFDPKTLHTYLDFIEKNGVEDHTDSDNKARAIVKRWSDGDTDFVLTPKLKILLIKEMQSGFTGDDDERAILKLLHGSTHAELEIIFGAGGVDPKDLDSDFQGDEENELRGFYDLQFEGGHEAVLKGSRKLKPEVMLAIRGGYSWPKLQAMLGQRTTRIETSLRGISEKEREATGRNMARADAAEVYQELRALTPDEHTQAMRDLAGERVRRGAHLSDVEFKLLENETKELKWDKAITNAAVLLIDFVLEPLYRDIALAAPKGAKAFSKETTPLTADQEKAAHEALLPVQRAKGNFVDQLPGEKETYGQKIEARTPAIVDESYRQKVGTHTEAEHDDASKVHKLSELERVGKASQKETDRVYRNFKTGPEFKADKFDNKGAVVSKGNIHDVWQGEQAKLKNDPNYKNQSAWFWMFYLIQNDDQARRINFKHNATPKFDQVGTPQNDEAKAVHDVGSRFINTDDNAKRLFDIGRAWTAFSGGGQVSVQVFKNPDAREDRRFMWKSFYVMIHEYLHTLKDGKYNDYAEKLGGEHTTEGGTLLEGVDSLLAETVWTSAKPRAAQPEIREAVEPEAVKAGEPYDASLLPEVPPSGRYDTYRNAIKLAGAVGIRNLYAAYFYGDLKLIGGKPP
ncbi:MAG: DUF4157 domain-containing protein [Gammaproteobacteria bacterium]|nr:DUF4157 domain-containing protein [Gammaproteobacteria bacterium]